MNEQSRAAFLKDLYGESSEGDWAAAAEAKEPWALKKVHKDKEKSSLLDERQEAEELEAQLIENGMSPRKAKLAKLKKAADLKCVFLLSVDPQTLSLAESLPIELTIQKNPKQALEALKQKNYDLVIIDFELPIANGLQFLNTVRASDDWKLESPVVMITKQVTPAMVKHGKSLRVNKWLVASELKINLAKTLGELAA